MKVNPDVVPYINLYPLPNGQVYEDGTGQFLSSPLVPTNEDNVMVRVYQLPNGRRITSYSNTPQAGAGSRSAERVFVQYSAEK